MSLDTDAAYRHAFGLQLFDERDRPVALGFVFEVVVVVDELRLRVGLVRILEGLLDVVGADDLVPERLTQRAVFVEGFVDHVPALDLALVAADDGEDMVLHAGEQGVAGEQIALVVVKHPGRNLAVPNQVVAHDEHVVLLAEGDVLVGETEVVLVGLGMNDSPT